MNEFFAVGGRLDFAGFLATLQNTEVVGATSRNEIFHGSRSGDPARIPSTRYTFHRKAPTGRRGQLSGLTKFHEVALLIIVDWKLNYPEIYSISPEDIPLFALI